MSKLSSTFCYLSVLLVIKVLREAMMKRWWQGSKMKNSVDGSKNRYGKESTYLRHVFSSELFVLFLHILAKFITNFSSLLRVVISEKFSV